MHSLSTSSQSVSPIHRTVHYVFTVSSILVRHVPEWLPGAAWKKKVPKYRKTLHDAVNLIYDWVKGQVVRPSSFVCSFL